MAYFGTPTQIVAEEFSPERGWVRQQYRKTVSLSWLRKLGKAGVTHVALRSDGRLADFEIRELLSRR